MPSLFFGSVDVSQPRPYALVRGGPKMLEPPSSSSLRMRLRLAAVIWEQSAADLVRAGSAETTAMILPSRSLSARTISEPFMTTLARTLDGTVMAPLTSESEADEIASILKIKSDKK